MSLVVCLIVCLASVQVVYATEFINNPDFEEGRTGWIFTPTVDVSTDVVYEGSYSCYLPSATAYIKQPAPSGVWNDGEGGITNMTHLSLYVRHDGSGTHDMYVVIEYSDESWSYAWINDTTTTWQYFNIFSQIENGGKGIYSLNIQNPPDSTVGFYLDWVTFGDGDEPPAPTPTPGPLPVSPNVLSAAQVMATLLAIVGLFGGIGLIASISREESLKTNVSDMITGYVIAVAFLAIMYIIFQQLGV